MWVIQSEVGLTCYFWIPNSGDAYVIGNDGSLWSRYQKIGINWVLSDSWTRLNPTLDRDGYLKTILSFNGTRYCKKIHKLVCEAVYGFCPAGLEVCHNDGNILNNNWWNLRYDTTENNHIDKIAHGTDGRGEKNSSAVLTWVEVREIRVKYASGGYTYVALALEYGVSPNCIRRIVNNITWVEVLV